MINKTYMRMDILLNQNLLTSLENISSAASTCNFDFRKLSSVSVEISSVAEFLSLTSKQTVIFSCIADLSFQRTVTLENLARHLKCSVLKILTYMQEIEELEKKGHIQKVYKKRGRSYSYNDIGFTVPHFVIEAIRNSDPSMLESATKFDLPGFLKQVRDIVEERRSNTLTTKQVIDETTFLISNNLELPYVRFVDTMLSEPINKCTILSLSFTRLKGQYNVSIDRFADTLFDDLGELLEFSQQLVSGNHELIRTGMLKLVQSEFDGDRMVRLSQKTATELYKTYPALLILEPEKTGLIASASIREKKLHFNGKIIEQLGSLEEVMKPTKFRAYRNILVNNGLSSGITAIFYGPPGTGKTEMVYQLSRKSGRDILMVDLSKTKSKWFGESEKLVKKVFDDYSELLQNSNKEPILFFNEADGIFSRRLDLSNRGTSSDQAINTIQNILLQALESFEGILIATTNLTDNLDRAFERRFTFKINFPNPDKTVRRNIWKNKLPELSSKQAAMLGEKFEMSGGEIDVQVRHILLKKVIRKKISLIAELLDSCNKEHGFSMKKKVGF